MMDQARFERINGFIEGHDDADARHTSPRVKILLVEDEQDLAGIVSMALRSEGWDVCTVGDGATAIALSRNAVPDVVILDAKLAEVSALEVLTALRRQNPRLAVLMLAAKDSLGERIVGLTAGGDECVMKPFSLEEVVLRVRALLRRRGLAGAQEAIFAVGDLTLDDDSHDVVRGGRPIGLTATEFELLRFMMRKATRVLSKRHILDCVWHYDYTGQTNVVELYVSYLRRKIDAGRPPMIHTLRGAGYVLKPATELRGVGFSATRMQGRPNVG